MDSTSFVNVTISKKGAENRTSPVYVSEAGTLSLQDILSEKPSDFHKQIDISWISDALNKKAMEVKYAPWDALPMPHGLWCFSAYGNNTIIAVENSGNIAVSYDFCKSFTKKNVCDNISGIAFGDDLFAVISSNGKIYISSDNGAVFTEITYKSYDFTCIAYNNGTFLLGTACGKIFATMDKFVNFTKIADFNDIYFTKILYINNIIMALSSNESKNLIYSKDFGAFWNIFNMPFSQGASICYGKDKFIACSAESNEICFCFEKDIKDNNPLWQKITLYKDNIFSDIAFGLGVYVLVSLSGVTMASYDGIKWIETNCPDGAWANILRTDYFFTAFSISENKDNLLAAKSSNGGLAGIMFATLEEVISDENVDKSINPYTLKDYLKYKTGKNKGQYPVYGDDLLIECTSINSRQIKYNLIDNKSSIIDFNDIKTAGIYLIEKMLNNAPMEYNIIYLQVKEFNGKIYQYISDDDRFIAGFKRYYNAEWFKWQEEKIYDDKIHIKTNSTFEESSNILMDNNSVIKKVPKENILENIIKLLLEHGKIYYWNDMQSYSFGALVLGSDKCLYFCLQENGTAYNIICNPVSMRNYWVKIINNDGKLMADNLSVTLGAFALLNEISLSDNRLKNLLPISKGGTGAASFQNAANNLLKSVPSISNMADSEYIYVYSAGNVKKISLSSLNSILKASLPIGFIYMQLRGQSTPDVLFKTTGKWQDISATYAGEFFRAVGGNSAAFGSKQNEGLPNITANWGETYLRQNKNIQPSGAATGSVALAQAFGNSTVTSINSIGFNASYANTIYGSSTHVTPYNSAIRIWKKIS